MTEFKEETMLVHPVVIPGSGTRSWTVLGVAVSTSFGPTYYFDSAPPGLWLLWRGVIVLL